jgi:hypothetical protein
MKNFSLQKKGLILINALIFAGIAIVITTALVTWGTTILRNSEQLTNREQAFEIAEAGIDYYRWHLAHAQTDYYDGNASTTSPGPYVHPFLDKDGNVIGQYALTITPPLVGTTIVTITATGTVTADPTIQRVIQTKLAIPSLANYAVVANDNMNFGSGTVVYGPIQSNLGIHFDGVAHNTITSSLTSYVDPDLNDSVQRYAVYTTGDPLPANQPTPPADSSIFLAGRQFPVPVVDFSGLTTDLSQLKTTAQQTSNSYFSSSGVQGYHIVLKTNDTFDLYKVTALQTLTGSTCSNDKTDNPTQWSQITTNSSNWGSWSIKTQTFVANYTLPSNGVIFVEDNLWVDGAINTARLTIAAGTFPYSVTTSKSITVNSNLTYTNFDGRDVLALIAQNNINVGFDSLDTMTIDGALVAQNGRAGRYYYNNTCYNGHGSAGASSTQTTLNLDGMIATNQRYGFAYSDGTGYTNRNIAYDSNLLYGPPPSFPLASSQYSTISWSNLR